MSDPVAHGMPEWRAVALAAVAGAGVSLQAYVNGKLAGRIGSTPAAALISFVVGLVVLLALAAARGVIRPAIERLRSAGGVRWWYFVGGLAGAYLVASTAEAAPELGVALMTVAIVAGQTGGSLGVDAAGLGPGGVQAVTARRLAGVAVAIVAVLVSALAGGTGNPHVGLLLLVALAGLGVAFQQAANGRLQQASGETIFAAVVNFLIGTLVLGLLVLVTRPHLSTLAAPVPLYAGGLLGAGFVLTAAATVRVLGVLRLSLVVIAGQSAGSLVLDGLDPAPGRHLGLATVLGVVLTVVAVAISRSPARQTAAKR